MGKPAKNTRARSLKSRRLDAATSGREGRRLTSLYESGKMITADIQHAIDLSEVSPPDQPLDKPWDIRLMGEDSANRKRYPITTGFLDYFPDAIQAAAEVSFVGNLKHNPGEPMHHARGKSSDHADCIARHMVERGGFVDEVIDGKVYRIRHSAALFWRAGALLQEELEAEGLVSLPRGAKLP
jgi:hypothetical protein